MKQVIIASKNPVKREAVQLGFQKMFHDEQFLFQCIQAESDIVDQPMSDKETLQGAINRAQNAKKRHPNADYCVGLEGGLEERDKDLLAFAWAVVISANNKVGKGRTASFFLPPRIAELIHEGYELGKADDMVFNRENSKQQNGATGVLTHNVIDRATGYHIAVIYALIPFKNPELY